MPKIVAHIAGVGGARCEHVRQRRDIGRYCQQDCAQHQRAPQQRIAGDLVSQDARPRIAHVEDVPELREGQRQEGTVTTDRAVQIQPQPGQRQRTRRCRRSARGFAGRSPIHCARPRIGSFGSRGGRWSTSRSPSPMASAKAGKTSVTRLRYKICSGRIGRGSAESMRQPHHQHLAQYCRTADRRRSGGYCRR